jgi:hypothetical protein
MVSSAKDELPAVQKYRCNCSNAAAPSAAGPSSAVPESCNGTIEIRCAVDKSHAFLVGERITLKITHPARK